MCARWMWPRRWAFLSPVSAGPWGYDGNIQLTESGRQRAESVYERHRLITDFLVETVGADPAIAEQDACKIEHIISPEVFAGIKAYLRK